MLPEVVESYAEWQSALARSFLHAQEGPVVLFVDDDELRNVRADLECPADDLERVVRGICVLSGGSLFDNVTRMRANWLRGDRAEPPPVLPVLALTVLAATRMRSDEDGRSTNYYLRLAQALAGDDEALEHQLRTDLKSDDFLDVVNMWRALHDWIEAQNGAVGTSTIRTHERLNRIGYPQSQALLRLSDRAELTRFFEAFDVRRSGVPDAESILRGLDVWTSSRQNVLGDTFMAALGDADKQRPLVGAVVQALAEAWDGRVITRDGKRRIQIRLGLDLDEWSTRWLFPADVDGPDELTLAIGSEMVALTKRPPSRYYGVTNNPPPVTADTLKRGLRLRGAQYDAEFVPTDVLLFRLDSQTGNWSSAPGIAPYEEHVLAVSGSELAQVKRVLGASAEAGWRLRPPSATPLLPGFALIEQVRFTNQHALEAALRDEPGLRSLGVAPTLIPRARFVRGLPLASELARDHYLVGGEPDLLLPTAPEPTLVPMTLDSKEDYVPAYGFPLELRRFDLDPGQHEVDADGQRLSFTLLVEAPAIAEPEGTGSLGWTPDGVLGPVDDARIIGGLVDDNRQSLIALGRRACDETWLLLDGGGAQEVAESSAPPFAAAAGFDFRPNQFEIPLTAQSRWLAQRKGAFWRLSALPPTAIREVSGEFDVLGTWKKAFADENGQTLWELQLRVAGG